MQHYKLNLFFFGASLAMTSSCLSIETLRIGLPAVGMASSAPLYVAQERGYFKDAGIEIDIAIYRGGSAAQEALVAGGADIINPSLAGAALAIRKGVNQKCVVGANGNEAGWYLLVRPDDKITSPKDLQGQRIGISAKASNTDYFSLWTQKQAGIKAMAVPLGSIAAQVGALKSGQVAAIPASPPASYTIVKSGQAKILTDYGKVMPPFYTGCWAAMVSLLQQKPTLVKSFFDAYLKGIAFMRSDRTFSLHYLKEYTEQSDPEILATFYEDLILGPIIEEKISRAYVDRALELATLSGVMDLPKMDEIFTSQFFPFGE